MKKLYITELLIENVRHLNDITIPLSEDEPRHLILTGKNGSGKTSVLDAMSKYLDAAAATDHLTDSKRFMQFYADRVRELRQEDSEKAELLKNEKLYEQFKKQYLNARNGIEIVLNEDIGSLRYAFEKGEFLLAYYKATRVFNAEIPKHIENVELKDKYMTTETPRDLFVKYLADLKVKEALARTNGNQEKADSIKVWFDNLQKLLREIFADAELELIFDEDTYAFLIMENGREPFGFNELSSGYAAVLDIVLDLIVRMEKFTNRSFRFDMPGIVLVDEIETHLHLDLQRSIMKMLTTVFPNIQFIVTTHSPFILNSVDNAVIYDLENAVLVKDGLTNVPYEGIVKSYFNTESLSNELKEKFERYKALAEKEKLEDVDFEELAELEVYLDEIPDYLALDITTEYQRLKLQLENRGDI